MNKVVVVDAGTPSEVTGRIVETEAYRSDDPASHSFNGPTPRSAVMFGPPGVVYVYLSYGIHHCVNVVAGADGDGQAVLLRAVTPLDGLDLIRERRAGRADRELANGPGKLCVALGIDLADNGTDLLAPSSRLRIVDDGTSPPANPVVGPRVGITRAVDTPWRFRVSAR
ncbi:MAG: DNA-3-methyladenine glycosylase [Ilumatobacteraceae bacterium]